MKFQREPRASCPKNDMGEIEKVGKQKEQTKSNKHIFDPSFITSFYFFLSLPPFLSVLFPLIGIGKTDGHRKNESVWLLTFCLRQIFDRTPEIYGPTDYPLSRHLWARLKRITSKPEVTNATTPLDIPNSGLMTSIHRSSSCSMVWQCGMVFFSHDAVCFYSCWR